jgi:hypothetical protein
MEAPLRHSRSIPRTLTEFIPVENPAEYIDGLRVYPAPIVRTQHPFWVNIADTNGVIGEEKGLRRMHEWTIKNFWRGKSSDRVKFAGAMEFNKFRWRPAAISKTENLLIRVVLKAGFNFHYNPRALRNNESLYVQEGGLGSFLSGFGLNNEPPQSHARYNQQGYATPIRQPIEPVALRIALNRDVCGGEFADRYGAFIVLGLFAVGIILEFLSLAILSTKRNRWLGWGLAIGSLIFWIVAGLTPMIGRLPWDWGRTYNCQQQTEYRQTF